MPVRVVESKQNARLKELRKALAAAGPRCGSGLRRYRRTESARRGSARGSAREYHFCGAGSGAAAGCAPRAAGDRDSAAAAKLLDSALATETPQPIAALVEPPNWTWAHVLDQDQEKTLVVVLAGIQDPGNLGTILRSAEAFGATGVVSLPGTVSAWNPKAVRASAGSVFRVPLLAVSERGVP